MIQEQEQTQRRAALLCWVGLLLLAVVFLTPHGGQFESRSFYQVARDSTWQNWGEWPAAWCSVKIILLCLGLALLLLWIALLLMNFGRTALSWLILCCAVAPGLGILLGLYFLVKALL